MEPPMDLLKQPRTSFCASSIISAVTSMNSYVKKKLPLSFQNTMMSCYFIVGSHNSVMAVYEVYFDNFILDAYLEICDHLFNHDLKKFYIPGKRVPDVPEDWKNAFKFKSLKSLKIDDESFKFKLGLWRVLNIDIANKERKIRASKTIPYPLPPTVRINPLSIAMWDSLKGGGDTITKLIDNVQERVGIRSDNTTATARLLMYFAVAFHRGNQWCHAKEDLTFYPTIAHARNANNKRSAMYDSLLTLSTMLLAQSRSAALQTPMTGLDGE